MGFENAEFYIKRWPELDGQHFSKVLICFPDAIPCGVRVADEGGKIVLNPDDHYILKEGDEVLVIAEDDDTYAPAPPPEVIFSVKLDSKRSCGYFSGLIWFKFTPLMLEILTQNMYSYINSFKLVN